MSLPDNLTSAAGLQAILDAALDCIICIDSSGCILEFNLAAEKVFGFTRAEVLGKELAETIVPPELREPHRKGLARYLESGQARVLGRRIEIPAIKANGERLLVELAITEVHSPQDRFFTAYLRDITQLRKAEERRAAQYQLAEALSQNRAFASVGPRVLEIIAQLADWSFGAIWLQSKDGTHLDCVESWHRGPSDYPTFKAACDAHHFVAGEGLPGRVVATGTAAWIRDLQQDTNFPRAIYATHDGLCSAFAFPLFIESNIFGVVEMFSPSIHEPDEDLLKISAAFGSNIGQFLQREFNEADLIEQRRIAEEANLAKDEFIAMLSHELRVPLNPISLWAEYTINDPNLTSEQRSDAQMIHRCVGAEIRLIDDLLDTSRIRHKKLLLNRSKTSIAEIIHQAVELALPFASEKQIKIVEEMDSGLPIIDCDPNRIRQVVSNLLQNACKFTSTGGQVSVKAVHEDDAIEVQINDNGIGIAQEMIHKLFDPFEQGSGAKAGGLGLGLAICKGIVELHNGKIAASSLGLGHGATFCFQLPI